MFAKNKKQEIIIAGGGYFGSVLANHFDFNDNQVTVIDINGQKLNDFKSTFPGRTVEGDASNIDVLLLAGIKDASAVVSATNDDHVNLMIASIATEIYGIQSVIALVHDAGILTIKDDYNFLILCPSLLVTQNILSALNSKTGVTL